MYTNNPYAQGGWYNPENPLSINTRGSGSHNAQPPTFGALPSFSSASSPSFLSFQLLPQSDLLTGTSVTLQGKKFYDIRTDISGSTSLTTFTRPTGEVFAVIEWQQHPIIQIGTVVPRQTTAQWIGLSTDRSSRIMRVGCSVFTCMKRSDGIHISALGSNPQGFTARVTNLQGNLALDVRTAAIQAGLLETFVVVAVLLSCGRFID